MLTCSKGHAFVKRENSLKIYQGILGPMWICCELLWCEQFQSLICERHRPQREQPWGLTIDRGACAKSIGLSACFPLVLIYWNLGYDAQVFFSLKMWCIHIQKSLSFNTHTIYMKYNKANHLIVCLVHIQSIIGVLWHMRG